jgi:hypothetical protein
MSSPINVAFSVPVGTPLVIPCNRWGPPRYTLQISTGGTAALEGTTQKLNQGETAVWAALDDDGGTPIATQGVGIVQVATVAVDAVRITATTSTLTGNFIQQGQTD